MAENRKLLASEREKTDVNDHIERPQNGQDLAEVKEAQQSVSEGLNVLGENAEVMGNGEVNESEKKDKAVYTGSGSSSTQTTVRSSVKALPTIEIMIEQTVQAIENELKARESEVKNLTKNKMATAHEVNEVVRRIRVLNGFLYQLQRAAKLAEDFVIGLWKQFVKKA